MNICIFRFTIAGSPVVQSICMNPIQNDQALLSVAHLRYSDDNNDYDDDDSAEGCFVDVTMTMTTMI